MKATFTYKEMDIFRQYDMTYDIMYIKTVNISERWPSIDPMIYTL